MAVKTVVCSLFVTIFSEKKRIKDDRNSLPAAGAPSSWPMASKTRTYPLPLARLSASRKLMIRVGMSGPMHALVRPKATENVSRPT